MKSSLKPGYTLLEMLIAITIFSALLIIILATFSRSAGSSAQVNVIREKSSVARSVMDQIANEFRFAKRGETITGERFSGGQSAGDFVGFAINSQLGQEGLLLVLQFPGEEVLVRKEYIVERPVGVSVGNNDSSARLLVKEQRGCRLQGVSGGKTLFCPGSSPTPTSLLSEKFLLNVLDNPSWSTSFTGLAINNPHSLTGYLSINLVIKPSEYKSEPCSRLPQGTCFRVSTTLNAGVL